MRALLATLLLAALPALAGFRIEKLAEGVFASIRTEPPGVMFDANVVFIVNDADVVVVDANVTPSSARASIAALRAITAKPVRYLVNTHWHLDHVTGNATWKEAYPGLEIVAHASAREDMARTGEANRKSFFEAAPGLAKRLRALVAERKSFGGQPLTDEEASAYESDARLVESFAKEGGTTALFPTIGIDDRLTLVRGARTIDIRHLGAGHSRADLVVHLPREGILVTGDLVVWPVPLVGSTSLPSHYAATLKRLLALEPRVLVPGHGPVLRDTDHVTTMIGMLESVTRQVDAALKREATLAEARKSVDLAEFRKAFAAGSPQRGFIFDSYVAGPAVQAAYEQAKAGFAKPTHPALREELLKMAEEDQRHRQPGKFDAHAVGEVDRINRARLEEIVSTHGWPTISMVGEDGARAAWLIAQHADRDRPFQRQVLALMEPLVKAKEARAQEFAFLFDRVSNPQRYGTQGACAARGKWVPRRIEDEPNVDRRRGEVGLRPLNEYAEQASKFLCVD